MAKITLNGDTKWIITLGLAIATMAVTYGRQAEKLTILSNLVNKKANISYIGVQLQSLQKRIDDIQTDIRDIRCILNNQREIKEQFLPIIPQNKKERTQKWTNMTK